MQKNRIALFVRAALAGLAVAAAIILGLRLAGAGSGERNSGEEALATPIRTKVVKGETRVVIAPQDLAISGIVIEPLMALTYQQQARALGTVVSPQQLAEQLQVYQMAVAAATHGELAVRAARIEAQRLLPLHGDDRIVSDKAFEAAQSDLATEEADFKAARAQLHLQQAALKQQWGPVLATWLANHMVQLDSLLAGQNSLIQITLPMAGRTIDPRMAKVEAAPGVQLDARIISSVPQADPKFQGESFYAVLTADPRLRAGMTIPAALYFGAPITGVVVPDAAVVRWQGKPWVFAGTVQGEFVRRPVATDIAAPGGWLITSGLSAGTPVVIRGAQLLLSEEIKAQPAERGE